MLFMLSPDNTQSIEIVPVNYNAGPSSPLLDGQQTIFIIHIINIVSSIVVLNESLK